MTTTEFRFEGSKYTDPETAVEAVMELAKGCPALDADLGAMQARDETEAIIAASGIALLLTHYDAALTPKVVDTE